MKDLFEFSELLDQYAGLLTDHQREIACQYVYEDFSLFEISERTGISRQGVWDIIRRAEAGLRRFESRTGLVRRFADQRRIVERMESKLEELSARLSGEDKALAEDIRLELQELRHGI